MYKSSWIGGAALVLLSAAVARAEGPLKDVPMQAGTWHMGMRAQPVKLSDYWLGLECYPAREALRVHLKLPEDQGLVVHGVLPDSPAAKAGIKRHDILLKAGDKPLEKVQDMADAIEATKEGKLPIELMRGGKRKTLSATPAKRPAKDRPKGDDLTVPNDSQWDTLQKWFERMRSGQHGKPPMRFRFFHPGAILPSDAPMHLPLPANMSIAVTKQGDKPAKIVVRRGDEQWECTEKDLAKLPEDIRPHVEQMLGRVPLGKKGPVQMFDFVPRLTNPPTDILPPDLIPPGAGDGSGLTESIERRMEKRMDDMNRRLEQLRKSMENLRDRKPLRKSPEKKPDKA